jgi:polyhydroxyalkanoate synthesis regulator phasin
MTNILNELLNSGNTWASNRAQYALGVDEAVRSNQMTASEAKEILDDLISTQNLEAAAASEQTKDLLVEGIEELVKSYA